MHGVRRQRRAPPSEPADAVQARRDLEQRRIGEYTQLCDSLYAKRASGDANDEAFDLTTRVLTLNPEFQSAWGFRRRILQKRLEQDPDNDARQKRLEADLQLTNAGLQRNPKNYSVWEHRKWVLDNMPTADWNGELMLVELYLKKDGRNFHTWDYRRYIMANLLVDAEDQAREAPTEQERKSQPTVQSELAFTTRKISENFSNFSAWHYRTKLLARQWNEKGLAEDDPARVASLDQEFELVRQALWSDPNDQSAWLYHRWLIGQGTQERLRLEIADCEQLLEEEPDCRWVLDSLVTYKRKLALQLEEEAQGASEEADRLKMDCIEKLQRLQEVDPMRRARYVDICYALWLRPADDALDQELSRLIEHLADQTGDGPTFRPHVTLLSGITSDTPEQHLEERLRTAVRDWASGTPRELELRLDGVDTRSPRFFQFVFAHIEANAQLLSLRAAVRDGILPDQQDRPDDYMPHLSLAYGTKGAQELIDSLAVDEETSKDTRAARDTPCRWKYSGRTFRVAAAELWACEGPPSAWKVVATVPLATDA